MGEVVGFRSKPKKQLTPHEEFEQAYMAHHAAVSALTDRIVVELTELVDIDKAHPYDRFMLRESIMSLVLRSKDKFHPLQEFTVEFVDTFGDDPKDL
jgi:hypothetical protein